MAQRGGGPWRSRETALALALLLLPLLAYLPVTRNGYIWDDDSYLTGNETLRDAGGLARIWFDPGATPQYYPLVHTSFWIEYRLWGLHPLGYHLVNVLLHGLAAWLAWRLLRRLRVPGAWFAALLFALHPVHVESAAWVAERKNVLSGVLYLAAFLEYVRFAEMRDGETGPQQARRARRSYAWSLALFAGALLSKTVAATLPVAIAIAFWWRGRLDPKRELRALAPFLALGVGFGALTAYLEKHHVGAMGESWDLDALERLLIAGRAVWFYLGKLVWPGRLTFIYPRWEIDAAAPLQWAYPLAALGLLVALWAVRRRWGRGPLAALLFFGVTLFPALGFFDVYPFRFSFVADHFQYLASLGPLALAGAGVARAVGSRGAARATTVGIAALLALALGGLTWQQARVYRDEETLWRDTLRKSPGSWMAYLNLGGWLDLRGRTVEAVEQYRRVIEIRPGYASAHNNLGIALERLERFGEAEAAYRAALALEPQNAEYGMNLANLFTRTGRADEAIEAYRAVLRANPGLAAAGLNLGALLARAGSLEEAAAAFEKLLAAHPGEVRAWINLGLARLGLEELPAAREAFERAIAIDRRLVAAHLGLARVLRAQGETQAAAAACRAALQIEPSNGEAQRMLGELAPGGR